MESSHRHRVNSPFIWVIARVGKTYEMLSNGIDLYKEGVDIKIGYIEHINVLRQVRLLNNYQKLRPLAEIWGHLFHFIDVNQIVEGHQMLCLSTRLAIRISQNTTFKALHGY